MITITSPAASIPYAATDKPPMPSSSTRSLRLRAFAALAVAVCAGDAGAQLLEKLPEEMEGVGIDDKSGTQLPLGLRFRDENGRAVTLAEVFDGDRPVLLSLNYSNCPLLCGVQLNGLVDSIRKIEGWTAGREFDVVSVSVDPLETTHRAKQTEQKYLERYARRGAAEGFRFLTGSRESIRTLADAVGFRYKYIPETREYSHSAAEIVVSPGGMVSRYLYGVAYDPQTVRLSLVEAGEGKIGSPLDRIILFCFHYDETKGRYGPVARRVMSVGAGVTVVALGLGLAPYWLRRSGPAVVVAAAAPSDPPADSAEHANPAPAPHAEREPVETA